MNGERFARISERAVRCREMSASDWRVLVCIALHAGGSDRAYPGMTTIAEMTGLKRKNVPRVVRRLERLGLVRHEPGGPNGTNLYVLDLGAPVSSMVRTGVLNGEDRGCPQHGGQGVLNAEPKVSSTLRTKHNKEQNTEHKSAGKEGREDWFEHFWSVYPDRGDLPLPKKPAKEKFALAVKGGADPAVIVRAAENYRRVMARYQGEKRSYVKQPANWLSAGLWEQYQADPAPAQPKFGGML